MARPRILQRHVCLWHAPPRVPRLSIEGRVKKPAYVVTAGPGNTEPYDLPQQSLGCLLKSITSAHFTCLVYTGPSCYLLPDPYRATTERLLRSLSTRLCVPSKQAYAEGSDVPRHRTIPSDPTDPVLLSLCYIGPPVSILTRSSPSPAPSCSPWLRSAAEEGW
jgi:hypothetical protein